MGLGLGLMDKDWGFEKVVKVKSLLPMLQERLPKSCNVFNMARSHHKFQNEMSFYILKLPRGTLNKKAWVMATYTREDYGIDISISAPRDLSRSREFKDALVTSGVIEWDEPFIFAAIDSRICSLVQDAILEATGDHSYPSKNLMFYKTPQCHPLVSTSTFMAEGSTIELKPLDTLVGAKFLVDNWHYAKTGSLSYVRKLIERNSSSGVFIDGKLIAGAALNGSGMIGLLHTLNEFRQKGYAQLCMNYFVQSLLKDNLIPCCTVEMSNTASLALQRKIGLQVSHEAYYITKSQS